MPLAGDAVTATVAPGGRDPAARSNAPLSGTSSNVGAWRMAARAARASSASAAWRRKSIGSDFRVGERSLPPGDEVPQRLVDPRVDGRRFVLFEHALPA